MGRHRHMAELRSVLPAAAPLPIWAVSIAGSGGPGGQQVDLSKGVWFPPTERLQRRGKYVAREESDVDVADPIRAAALDEAAKMPLWLQDLLEVDRDELRIYQATRRRRAEEGEHALVVHLNDLPGALDAIRSGDVARDSVISTYWATLRRSFELGLVAADDAESILRQCSEAIRTSQAADEVDRLHLTFELYEAIISGVADCKITTTASFPATMWNSILVKLSDYDGSERAHTLTKKLLRIIRPSQYNGVRSGIQAIFGRFFERLGNLQSFERVAMDNRRIQQLLGVFRHDKLDDCKPILDSLSDLLLSPALADLPYGRRTRYGWLLSLSTLRPVTQEYLTRSAQRLFPDDDMAIPKVCWTLSTHWAAQGLIYWRTAHRLRGTTLPPNRNLVDEGWCNATLARFCIELVHTIPPKVHSQLIRSLGSWFREMNLAAAAIASFEELAWSGLTEDEARAARRALEILQDTLNENGTTVDSRHVLNLLSASETRMAKAKAFISSMPPAKYFSLKTIRDAIEGSMLQGLGRRSCHRQQEARDLVPFTDKLAIGSALAPHISNRQAFRFLEQSLRSQMLNSRGPPSPVLITTLLHILMRDNESSLSARMSRIRWILKIMRYHYGEETAERARVQLDRWLQLTQAPCGSETNSTAPDRKAHAAG